MGGSALIGNGQLLVELDGYTPTGGENLSIADGRPGCRRSIPVDGLAHAAERSRPGNSWSEVGSIDLLVSLPGDFNGNGVLDAETSMT